MRREEWLVSVPEYDRDGVKVERFEVTQREQEFSELRAHLNPQRSDRSVVAGTYTRLVVDGVLWMSDTPAECRDLIPVANAMWWYGGRDSFLCTGLGLGVELNQAITTYEMRRIDVVEREQRVIDAVGPHYLKLAADHGADLTIHHSDIHDWKPERGARWRVGWFDIWPTICADDMAEVTRLRNRFRKRLDWFGAWAQDERIASNRRVRTKTGWY